MTTMLEPVNLDDYVTIWPDREVLPECEPVMIGDLMPALIKRMTTPPERWSIVRSGEREPIVWPLRLAVGRRDEFTCRSCHADVVDGFELDHIIPWSAGGSDRSDNLRTLCGPCNQRRSNFRDTARAATAVTWWCIHCWTDDHAFRWPSAEPFRIAHMVAAPNVTAYCAHCHHISQTDVTL
jgi:hypothetical protein